MSDFSRGYDESVDRSGSSRGSSSARLGRLSPVRTPQRSSLAIMALGPLAAAAFWAPYH